MIDNREPVTEQIKKLSSGTMATLTGYTRYNDLDAIQYSFLKWTEEHASHLRSWAEAWALFTSD